MLKGSWAAVAANPSDPEFKAGKKFTDTNKVVFTKTPDKSECDNTVLAKGDFADEITKLKLKKSRYGGSKDIIAYGAQLLYQL